MHRRWTLVLAAILMTAASCIGQQNSPRSKAERIGQLVSAYEKYGYLNGAILVAEHGEVIYAAGIGDANMERHIPNTPQTKFDIASITKQFTAALVLQQVGKGKIQLAGTVSEYLPWYRKDTGARMTVEQLVKHTSGLPPDFDAPEFGDSAAAARQVEPHAFAEESCQPALASEPGTKWAYSNCGYILLGLILERAAGKPFELLLQKQLLQPLGMNDSGMDRNNLENLGGASGYKRHPGPRYAPGPYIDRSHIFSSGSMYSTVDDLYRWNQALSGSNLFSADLRDQIFTPGLGNWANGWFVRKIPPGEPGEGSTIAETRCDIPGNFFSWVLRYPEQDDVIIVIRNVYGSSENLEQNLQAILFDREPRVPQRSPLDVLAHFGWVSFDWVVAHRLVTSLVLTLFGLLILRSASKRASLDSV
jgi:CubicO group peptidase (beta-lactamase class C family)